tara:strand:- start:113 stop:337 length:225 start_codon:yes stop_codon:yes gene_type:complete
MTDKIKTSYDKTIKKVQYFDDSGDYESAAITEFKIYKKFIRDIINGNIKNKEIKNTAEKINEGVLKKKRTRWFS